MDTSEEYYNMCIKAFKDIGILPTSGCPNQYMTDDYKEWVGNALFLHDESITEDDSVIGQLYRQDQLQEMLLPLRGVLLTEPQKYVTPEDLLAGICQYATIFNADKYNSELADSMERLWLAFVMHEKYGKKWVNGEWVK